MLTLHVREIKQAATILQYSNFFLYSAEFVSKRSMITTGQVSRMSWPCRCVSTSSEELGGRLLEQFTGNLALLMVSIWWVRSPGYAIVESCLFAVGQVMEENAFWTLVLVLPQISLLLGLWLLFLASVWKVAILTSIQDWMEVGMPNDTPPDLSGVREAIRVMGVQVTVQQQLSLLLHDLSVRLREMEERLAHTERRDEQS